MDKRTLVLGASTNESRYSNIATKMLQEYSYPVFLFGNKEGKIGHLEISTKPTFIETIDTVTLYLNPLRQESYYAYILSLHPRRIIFNPGTENETLIKLAHAHGIQTLEACTLVLLRTWQY